MLSTVINNIYYFLNGPSKLLAKKVINSKCKSVCIYGAGEIGEELLDILESSTDIGIDLVIDRKAEYIPVTIKSHTVSPPANLSLLADKSTVVIASEAFLDEIKERVEQETQGKSIHILQL